MSHPTIERARERVLIRRVAANRDLLEALDAVPAAGVPELLALADEVREAHCGNGVAVEVLYNAKKGGCSEDCNFCSQSARFASDVDAEPLSSGRRISSSGARRARARCGRTLHRRCRARAFHEAARTRVLGGTTD